MRAFSISVRLLACSLLLTSAACSSSESQPATPKASGAVPANLAQQLTANLKNAGLNSNVLSVQSTEIPGIYWVTLKGLPPVFTTADGKHIIQGDVVRLEKNDIIDIATPMMQADAAKLLASVPSTEMVTFSPQGKPKATIYVFTDADCGYCRKLHSEMDQILEKGIEVRYLAWPRSPQSMPDMNAVWCSEDRNSAMTQAKNGIKVQAAACENPVMKHREIGMQIGVNGTPAIYAPNGKYLGGYIPAPELAKQLGL